MDLNLIRIFLTIYETRSLTKTAMQLHVTQSAISQSLTKLRRALDDPLFERIGRHMEPNQVASNLYPTFHDALHRIDVALGNTVDFEPQTAQRQFKIALSELGEIGWLPNIVADIRQQAPNVQLVTIPLDVTQVDSWIQRGIVDLAIAPAFISGRMVSSEIKTQDYVALMSQDHEFAVAPLDRDAYARSPRVHVASDAGVAGLEEAEQSLGIEARSLVRIQHYSSMPTLILRSPEMIAVAPRSVAEGWARAWPLAVKELPFEMEPVRLCVYRRADVAEESGAAWLYRTVLKAVLGLPETFQSIHVEGAGRD